MFPSIIFVNKCCVLQAPRWDNKMVEKMLQSSKRLPLYETISSWVLKTCDQATHLGVVYFMARKSLNDTPKKCKT